MLVLFVLLTAALLVAIGSVWAFSHPVSSAQNPAQNPSPSYPTTTWNPTYQTPRKLAVSDLAALNATETPGTAYGTNNTLWFTSGPVTLVVYASPPEHDMAFVIQGMVNPTIHVAAGAHIVLTMVNLDPDEYHSWSLSTHAPPYSSMPMMGSGGMMSGAMMDTAMLGPARSTGLWSQEMSFTTVAGQYWYLCMVAGHASQGMYGGFVVG